MSARTEPLRLLHVEDSDDDAELVLRELARSGFEVTRHRVELAASLETALEQDWDLVLCDYTLPHLDAPTALEIVRKRCAHVPFIVVSGTVGEETAVEVMRAGANDYLLKGNLTRLGPAVRREVREGRARAERLRAERARQQAEESFRLIVESSPDLVVAHREGRIVYANPKTVERLALRDATAILGEPLSSIVLPDDRPRPAEQRWKRSDGQVIAVEVVQCDVVFEGTLATVVMARDLTERNQIAAAMVEMDRMAAIGMLAAGVGHEINNPLAYVLANLEFVTGELDTLIAAVPGEARQRLAMRIEDLTQALSDTTHGAERVRAIVGDLRTFSRGEDANVALIDVRQILDSSVRMAAVQIRQRATIVKSYAADLPEVVANESRVGQLFLNLVVNAAQALEEGAPSENRIELVAREDDGFVVVEIADTGRGIPADVQSRIFDPFFTTKPAGEGTGLGLSISRRIVEQLGGDISVASEPGKGTRFTVRIPRASGASERAAPTLAPRTKSEKRATILWIDDETNLGVALKRALVDEHDVVVTTSALEALARVAAGESFDLLLCDLMMPGMSGMDFHRELERSAPGLAKRVVFLAGGALTARSRDFLASVPNIRLDKPIELEALRNAIQEILGLGR
jgi:PAS domain S-box-containing protein